VDGVTPAEVEAGFPVRVVGIDGGRSAAIYWFQSRSAVTGALLERTLAEVTGRERRWALVSVLLEGWSPAELGGAQALLRQIRAAVAEALGSPADGGPQEIHEEARQETQQETHEETHRETHQAKTERRAT
jgi:hypothetical protein